MAVALSGNDPGGILDGTWAQSQPGYTGANGGFAAFATMQDGFNAQLNLLENGKNYLAGNNGSMTVQQIAAAYEGPNAPPSAVAAYANNIANIMGTTPSTAITYDNVGQFAVAQAQAENSAFNPSNVNLPGNNGTAAAAATNNGTPATPAATLNPATWIPALDAATKNMFTRGAVFVLALIMIGIGLSFLADKETGGALHEAALA